MADGLHVGASASSTRDRRVSSVIMSIILVSGDDA